MKLYYKPGACSLASHIILNELGAPFDLEKVDTANGRTENGADYSRISPNGYVPALQLDSGDIVTENPAILQLLGDRATVGSLVPVAGTMARIRLQEMLNFLSSELHKAFGPFFSGQDLTDDERANAEAGVTRRVKFIEATLAEKPYLLGDAFSVADAYAFVVLNWSNFVGIDTSQWPHVHEYLARVQDRPSVRKAMKAEGLIGDEAAA
ncbi:MAG: glutathione transferase GstA [Rhodospirillales bacterium]|nr:glutathione transferase GstA [Rhodospirillales bacterium]MBO6788632.1 glutathione transferase GstA [Rhodospirillales bacterium]